MTSQPPAGAAPRRVRSVRRLPHQDWRFLAILEDALREFFDTLRVKRSPALYGYIDFIDREALAFIMVG